MRKRIIATVLQYGYFLLGLWIMCFGIYLTIQARVLGVSPWDVFHLGLLNYFNVSFGLISQLVGAGVVILAMFLGIRPKLGTLLNMYLVGVFINILIDNHVVQKPGGIFMALIYLIVGILLSGFGTAMYITANLGAGPRDSLMLGLHKKTGFRIAVVRTTTEILAVSTGFFLGGPLGIGTLIFSLSIGPSVEMSLFILNKVKDFKLYKAFMQKALRPVEGGK